jgi:hypothetical protein
MLGHLVSVSRQSPPDFGITTWLRAVARAAQSKSQPIISQLSEALRHPRKHQPVLDKP